MAIPPCVASSMRGRWRRETWDRVLLKMRWKEWEGEFLEGEDF